jgi:signal transduction histidine kinase
VTWRAGFDRVSGRFRLTTVRTRLTVLAGVMVVVPLLAGAVVVLMAVRMYLVLGAYEYTRAATHRANDVAAAAEVDPPAAGPVAAAAELLRRDPRLEVQLADARAGLPVLDTPEPADLSLVPLVAPTPRVHEFFTVFEGSARPAEPVLVVRNTLERERRILDLVALALGGAVLGLTGLVTATTWIVAGRVLRPVEAIRGEVAEITANDLSRRVPVPRSRDEVARLAETMNSTLDRLEAAVDQQRRFVADASHELRSPLAALRAELEIALAHPGEAAWDQVVRDALTDADRLQRLTTDLLLLARLEQQQLGGRSDPAREPDSAREPDPAHGPQRLDLAALVREETGRRRVPPGQTREVTAGEVAVYVRARPALLARLLGNLLDNAERHAAGAVTVQLATAPGGAGVAVLEVLDDGPGIPGPDRARVFDRFTRLDGTRNRDTGGAGLGLAIARHIALAHGGGVDIVDSAHGARLAVWLPLVPDQGSPPGPDAGRDGPAAVGRSDPDGGGADGGAAVPVPGKAGGGAAPA